MPDRMSDRMFKYMSTRQMPAWLSDIMQERMPDRSQSMFQKRQVVEITGRKWFRSNASHWSNFLAAVSWTIAWPPLRPSRALRALRAPRALPALRAPRAPRALRAPRAGLHRPYGLYGLYGLHRLYGLYGPYGLYGLHGLYGLYGFTGLAIQNQTQKQTHKREKRKCSSDPPPSLYPWLQLG